MSSARVVIYTAVVGGKDLLQAPAHRMEGVDYVCFTDTPEYCAEGWEIRLLPFSEGKERKTARRIKLFPHELFPDHEISVWMDATLQPRCSLAELIEEMSDRALALFTHPERDCVYEEIACCAASGREAKDKLTLQEKAYRERGVPEHAGLYATSVMIRKHHAPEIQKLSREWWEQLCCFSLRDQVSLPVVLRELNIPVHAFEASAFDRYFLKRPHRWNEPGDNRNSLLLRLRSHAHYLFKRLFGGR